MVRLEGQSSDQFVEHRILTLSVSAPPGRRLASKVGLSQSIRHHGSLNQLRAKVGSAIFQGFREPIHSACFLYSASSRMTLMRSDLPSNPMPGISGMMILLSSTRTPSGNPP